LYILIILGLFASSVCRTILRGRKGKPSSSCQEIPYRKKAFEKQTLGFRITITITGILGFKTQ